MRAISDAALTILAERNGIEPVNFVKIYWTDTDVRKYGDKTLAPDIKGAILDLSAFDDVINFDGNASSQTFNITLDDVDGSIKAIYNVNNIHKRRVVVYQWFTGLSIDDAFIIFEGQINSPIVWKEGDRTLSFSVISQLEDQEVGFAPEEGLFDSIPEDLVGKPFPLIFGIARNVPCIKQDPIPTGILLDTMGVPDPSIPKQLANLWNKINQFATAATLAFYAAIEAYHSGVGTADVGSGGVLGIDDYWQGLGDGFVAQGNQALAQMWKIQQEVVDLVKKLNEQKSYAKSSLRVHNGDCFPQGQDATATLENGTKITGNFAGGVFQINGVTYPGEAASSFTDITPVPIVTSTDTSGKVAVVQKLGMVWEPADQPFKLESDIPVKYIACMLSCSVLNVWAYRNYNDTRLLMQVPQEYYSVSVEMFGSLPVTTLTLAKPLSYYDSKWDDSLFVDLQSSIGPNVVSIMTWLIQNYTTKSIDATSFAHVSALVDSAPANFALLRQENILKVLSDIAYQSRCSLSLKNNVFYLKYLPEEPTPVDTITLDDIIVNTLELHHTPTENLVTKLVAEWVPSYEGGKNHKIIIRNNTGIYGIHEQGTNWYIYTHPALVDVAASFWAIRKSNTWKLLKFETPLHKMRLESLDAITITIDYAANESVIGIIESVKLDTKALTLQFEVWIPVRVGEMTKYNFAWPVDSDVAVNPGNLDFQKPGHDATGNLGPTNGATTCNQTYTLQKQSRERVTHPTPHTNSHSVLLAPATAALDGTVQPTINYEYNNTVTNPADLALPTTGAFPATISGNTSSPTYTVRAYLKGANKPTSNVGGVLDISRGPKIPTGTWVTLLIITWTESAVNGAVGGRQVTRTGKYLVPSSTRNTFIGRIVSGEGDTYQVGLYTKGVTNPAVEEVEVKQLDIDSDETIPVDTWVLVVMNMKENPDGTTVPEYSMQVPVYM